MVLTYTLNTMLSVHHKFINFVWKTSNILMVHQNIETFFHLCFLKLICQHSCILNFSTYNTVYNDLLYLSRGLSSKEFWCCWGNNILHLIYIWATRDRLKHFTYTHGVRSSAVPGFQNYSWRDEFSFRGGGQWRFWAG